MNLLNWRKKTREIKEASARRAELANRLASLIEEFRTDIIAKDNERRPDEPPEWLGEQTH